MGIAYSSLVFLPPAPIYDAAWDRLRWAACSQKRRIPYFIEEYHGADKLPFTIIYSHGNAEDIGFIAHSRLCRDLPIATRSNVVFYDYLGYGIAEPRDQGPSERGFFESIETLYSHLTEKEGLDAKNIILMGRSLGSGPTSHLAHKLHGAGQVPCAGVMYLSPILSCVKVVFPKLSYIPGIDMFTNYRLAPSISCPAMVIHGDIDEVVPYWHGRDLSRLLPSLFMFHTVPERGHNDIEEDSPPYRKMLDDIRTFIGHCHKVREGAGDPPSEPNDKAQKHSRDSCL